jgi:phosphoenolpyruvate synthase/pyruvate phosphate dikinase
MTATRQEPTEQLRLAIDAVFESWWAKKAVEYRRIHDICRSARA